MSNWQNVITYNNQLAQTKSDSAIVAQAQQQQESNTLSNGELEDFKQWQAQRRETELKNAAINEWMQQNTQRPIESRTNKTMYGLIATGVALLAIKFGAPESLKSAENLRLIEDVLTILIPLLGALGIHFRNRAAKFITKQKAANHARNN